MIKLQNISKIYNKNILTNTVKALDKVSLCINEGEFVAIIGASGSGKSTLMNIIGCLDTPDEGEFFLNGKSLSGIENKYLDKIRRDNIGFIFQSFNLIPSLNAIENVMLPLAYRKIPKQTQFLLAKKSLIQVGLQDRLFHTPTQMSGGQQQRVAIARAIAISPPIILADEPTGNLDKQSTWEIMKILTDLNKTGKTIILITHDDSVANLSSRKIKVSYGKICPNLT